MTAAGTLAAAAAIGLLVGLVVGTLGAGGGVLTVPALVYLLGMPPHDAATASLVIVGVTSLVTLVPHARRGHVRVRGGLVFGAVGALASVGGARLAQLLAGPVLMAAFAGMLALVAALMARRALGERPARSGPVPGSDPTGPAPIGPDAVGIVPKDDATGPGVVDRPVPLVLLGLLVGLLTGLFGVGGGFVAVPALVLALRYPVRDAVGTSLLVIVVNSTAGLAARVPDGLALDWWP
ncbi:MAG: sulfite exporter TauE/SafE family protein, partial [Actinomycetaceae bacterium]